MKVCVIALVLAVGCGSKDVATSAGSAAPVARPSVTDPLGFCERVRAVLLGRRKCFPEDTSIKMGLESLDTLEEGAPKEPPFRRKIGADCAVMLNGMMRAEQPKNCPLDVTDAERKELADFLTSWYAQRTDALVTGNVAADAALAKLAALRDAACACKDLACAHKAGDDLQKTAVPLPADAPTLARDAASNLLDDVSRCKQKLTYGAP